jgi:probable HAF family extracellular repeat protein
MRAFLRGMAVLFLTVGFQPSVRVASDAFRPLPIPWAVKDTGAHDINNDGQVVGHFRDAASIPHGFIWDQHGRLTDLGASTIAYGINNDGAAVGISIVPHPQGGNTGVAFVWRVGVVSQLPHLGNFDSVANDINDDGLIVGSSNPNLTSRGTTHAVIWENDTITDIGTLGGGGSVAYGVNNLRQVVGTSRLTPNPQGIGIQHAFVWESHTGMVSLGALELTHSSIAYDVNNLGQVVGESYSHVGPPVSRCFMWTHEAGLLDIGTLPGGARCSATGINDQGHVVGWSDVSGNPNPPVYHPFLWTPSTGMIDLSIGHTLGVAKAISDNGGIVGFLCEMPTGCRAAGTR